VPSRPVLPRAGRRPARPGTTAAVVLAGGSGSRVAAALNKVYLPLAGRRVVSWSFSWAREVAEIGTFVLVVRPEDAELAERTLRREATGLHVRLVVGGGTRHESEQAALDHLEPDVRSGRVDVIAVHDAARPLAGPALFRSAIATAARVGGAVPALPASDLIPVADDGSPMTAPAPSGTLTRVQTPQAFRAAGLLAAYTRARAAGFDGTDTSAAVAAFSDLPVQVVAGSPFNLKVTYQRDLRLAERLLTIHGHRLP
jgi:2-C-methyl-D-erythritol 4-phosphate cytidylyltransferase